MRIRGRFGWNGLGEGPLGAAGFLGFGFWVFGFWVLVFLWFGLCAGVRGLGLRFGGRRAAIC
ncbi:hypothetical protein BCAR13_1300031 [Paraburkholderia caribensis]|nr:hypothetical protein BCAR13_1300031 [Paraburkholderia caribensis]